jgi:hypothetical protein
MYKLTCPLEKHGVFQEEAAQHDDKDEIERRSGDLRYDDYHRSYKEEEDVIIII